ncbi:MAG: hypothetical protein KatS3mg105_2532 [Gemmatales bacterium]|nr:MAG: hypothetical protein KatS3mg105_2532 [Gemmatales bacterium]
MTKAKREGYRKVLLAMQSRLSGDVSLLADEALHTKQQPSESSMPIHLADRGSDAYEQEFTLNLLANQEHVLEEIQAALERIDDGTYGKCEDCEHDIPQARLDAIPYARYCVKCARKHEQEQ